MRTKCFATILFLGASALAAACDYEEDEMSACDYYCSAAADCHAMSDQMFSGSECYETCQTSLERHRSVGCQDRYIDLVDCMVDLPCQSWNDYGSACALEIDYLDMCVDGGY